MSNIPPAPEPQGSQPAYQPPAPGASAQPPAPQYTPGAYPAAPGASYGSDPAAQPKPSNRLGLIALIITLAAVIIGSIVVYMGGQTLGGLVEYTGTTGTVEAETLPAEAQSAAASGALVTAVGFGIFGILALWGFIQGIVAAVKNRGRGWGIAAIILAVIGGGIVGALWFAGFTAGAGPYLSA
ncbi:hypothetical protein ACFXP7_07485 [Microbacterium sp. P06]|uniref:hypothetical protein n=1 Tax=unclassified Microbacterium TaxID=2609290 RepID=UPI0037452E85